MIYNRKQFFAQIKCVNIMNDNEFVHFLNEVDCTERHYREQEDIGKPIYNLITAGISPIKAVKKIDSFIEIKRQNKGETIAQLTYLFLKNYKPPKFDLKKFNKQPLTSKR